MKKIVKFDAHKTTRKPIYVTFKAKDVKVVHFESRKKDVDSPELTDAELKRARRVTPKETEAFRKAIEEKLSVSRPPRMGRPPKHPSEKFVPVSWRTPPEVLEWLIAQAHHAGLGKYQTFLSLLLRSFMRYEVVREKNGITLKSPSSDHVIVIASKESLNRASHAERTH